MDGQRTPLPPRFPTPEISKTSQFGGLMHVLPTRQQFLWPILSHKKVFDHQILPLYSCCLPTKKTFQRTPGRSRLPGPPLGVPRGPAAALGHLQVDEMPSLPWRGRRARSTRRAWSNKRGVEKVTTNEFLIAQWVILSWNPWVGRMARQPVELTRCVFSKKNEPADIGVYHLLISIYFYTHMYMCTIYYNIIYIYICRYIHAHKHIDIDIQENKFSRSDTWAFHQPGIRIEHGEHGTSVGLQAK